MVDETPATVPPKEHRVADWFREAWSQALVAVSAAEEEASRVLHRVGEVAGWKPEEVRRQAQEFGERLAAQRKEFERTLDEGIARAVVRVKIPKREEIDALGKRVGRITERIEALEARRKS
ncbi:MAG: phasin family protein [Deltaproteobacteria bacterium]|nr:phasin family protein [Deltaproteobacteria bacterium]